MNKYNVHIGDSFNGNTEEVILDITKKCLTYQVGIQLLHPEARLPEKANYTDSCYDVFAVSKKAIFLGAQDRYFGDSPYGYQYGLGFALDLPQETELQIRARSSIYKTGLILSNGIGTGDEGYTGEYSLIFYHVIRELEAYEIGDRVAQIQCVSRANIDFTVIDSIPKKDRGGKGFGSSGLN